MKWIGQHIWDFISRFRSDVYLEATESGTIASGGNLGLDSNNKIVKATGVSSASTVTVTDSNASTGFPIVFHDESNGLLDDTGAFVYNPGLGSVSIANTALSTLSIDNLIDNATSGTLYLKNTKGGGDGDDSDNLGKIVFQGNNDASGTPELISFAQIVANIEDASDTDEAGKLYASVAASNGSTSNLRQGLILTGHGTNDIVDINLGYGSTSTTTIAGTLTMGSTAFVNNSGVVQVATQGTIDHDSLANFVTAEHVDWAGASAGTIHSSNVPTLNQNTSGTAAGLSSTLAVGSGGTGLTTVATDTILTGNGTGALTAEASLKYTGSTGLLSAGLTNAKVELGRVRASSDSPSLLTTSSGSSIEIDTYHLFGTTVPTVVKFMPSGQGAQAQVVIEGPEGNGTDVVGTDMYFVPGAGTGDEPSGSFKFYGHAGGGSSDADVNVPTAMVTIGPQGNITTLGNLVVGGTPTVGWHGSHTTIKILHSDFSADDGGRPFMIDDTGVGSENLFGKTHSTMFAYATVAIPTGYKATHVMVYGDGARAVEVWEHQINSKTGVSKGTGNVDTAINITDVNSTATNYLFIQVAQTAVDEIHGGYITIATI